MKKKHVQGIAKDTLDFILEASRSSMPDEFAGLLQAEKEIITEVLILPGTESSRMSALIRLYMLPNMQVVGSAHSHPSSDIRPSKEDIAFFSRTGDYHIIVGPPFDESSWACYDSLGQRRELPVVDIEFEDKDFDDVGLEEERDF
ncbi:putative metalloprotease [uncultured archaeon]|nr:putative metalloprotease [uncultured archaeon]